MVARKVKAHRRAGTGSAHHQAPLKERPTMSKSPIRGNTEQAPGFGLEGATEHEFPLETKVEPGQMIYTITGTV